MEARRRTSKHKLTGRPPAPQELPKTPTSTPEAHGTDCDPRSEVCSRQRQLWYWFLESLGQEQRSPPPTPVRPTPPVEVMQRELLMDLLHKCAEYEQSEAEKKHKENFETWRKFTRAAVDLAWDEAQKRNGGTDSPGKDLAEEMLEEREDEEAITPPVSDEAPPVLIGLPSDEEASSGGSEKKRNEHVYRQERRERVRRWVKEQRELVQKQREARKHVQVPKQVARTWLDQLRQQAAREQCVFRSRAPGSGIPTREQRKYPWDDYLREKNGALVPAKSEKLRRDSQRETH